MKSLGKLQQPSL